MTNKKFENLFKGPRKPESDLTQKHMDIAASIQKVIEEIIVKIAKSIREETKEKNLCLAGGVALNCVANSVLEEQKIFLKHLGPIQQLVMQAVQLEQLFQYGTYIIRMIEKLIQIMMV